MKNEAKFENWHYTTKFENFRVSADWIGEKAPNWGGKQDESRRICHNRIWISGNSVTVSFDYWESLVKQVTAKPVDLLKAFCCMLSDAESALNASDFAYFCAELGYNEDSLNAKKIFKACNAMRKRCNRLGISDDEISGLRERIENYIDKII